MVRGAYGVGMVEDAGYTAGSHRGNDAGDRRKAVRAVASMAVDAPDCALLLEALGLEATEGKP